MVVQSPAERAARQRARAGSVWLMGFVSIMALLFIAAEALTAPAARAGQHQPQLSQPVAPQRFARVQARLTSQAPLRAKGSRSAGSRGSGSARPASRRPAP